MFFFFIFFPVVVFSLKYDSYKKFNIGMEIHAELSVFGPIANIDLEMQDNDLRYKLWSQLNINKNDQTKGILTIVRLDNVMEREGEKLSFSWMHLDTLWREWIGWPIEIIISSSNLHFNIPANPEMDSMQIELSDLQPLPLVQFNQNRDIPPIIHQITSNIMGKSMKVVDKLVSLVKIKNPFYEHRQYSLDESGALILNLEGPKVKAAFDALQPKAYKADLLRYVLLKHYGGIYMDSKLAPFQSLDTFLPTKGPLMTVDNEEGTVQNTFLAFPPGDHLMDILIERIVKNVEEEFYGLSFLGITGPHLVRDVIYGLGEEDKYNITTKLKGDLFIYDSNDRMILLFHNAEYRRMQELSPLPPYSTYWYSRKVYRNRKRLERDS